MARYVINGGEAAAFLKNMDPLGSDIQEHIKLMQEIVCIRSRMEKGKGSENGSPESLSR